MGTPSGSFASRHRRLPSWGCSPYLAEGGQIWPPSSLSLFSGLDLHEPKKWKLSDIIGIFFICLDQYMCFKKGSGASKRWHIPQWLFNLVRLLKKRRVFQKAAVRPWALFTDYNRPIAVDPTQQRHTDLQSKIRYNIKKPQRTSKASPTQSRHALHGEQAHEARQHHNSSDHLIHPCPKHRYPVN